jgi:hypothetical protein
MRDNSSGISIAGGPGAHTLRVRGKRERKRERERERER